MLATFPLKKVSQLFTMLVLAFGLSGCLGKAVQQLVKAPEIEDVSFDVGSMDFSKQNFVLKLKMKNPNFFALPLRSINYGLTMNGVRVAAGESLNKNIRLGSGQTEEVSLNLSTNLMKLLGQRALLSAAGGGLNYSVDGNVVVDGLNYAIPFQETGSVPVRF